MAPADVRAKLQGRNWGHIRLPEADLPSWLEDMPKWAENQVLAAGPAFGQGQVGGKLINSAKLIDLLSPNYERVVQKALDEDVYIMIADTQIENVILVAPPFKSHRAWIEGINGRRDSALVYTLLKHPEQET